MDNWNQRIPQPKPPVKRRSVKNGAGAQANSQAFFYVLVGAGVVLAVAILFAVVIPAIGHLFTPAENVQDAPPTTGRVSFVAVGDNLPDEYIGYYADSLSGEKEDDKYDYKPIFAPIKPYIEAADLAYIDQETHVGGAEHGVQGYPAFNTTDEMADAVVDAGFDLVASATNHSYDWGYYGALEHSLSVWEKKPVAFTGTAVTAEQYERIPQVERNGIKFALINYTYGVNGYTQAELPQYAVNFIDEARIRADVARAREEGADVVLAAMHWGTENLTEADEDQKKWAQLLADLDVDVVLGSHPHVIGPMEWVQNSNGSGHETLVAYSLGNFLADHETPHEINALEGMLSCDFVRDESSGEVRVENVKWTPVICQSNENRDEFAVYAIDDYTEEIAKKNRVFVDEKDPIGWIWNTTKDVVGAQWFESGEGTDA